MTKSARTEKDSTRWTP